MYNLKKLKNSGDVIAFPKIQNGNCLMMETPSPVHPEQLDVLKLKIIE